MKIWQKILISCGIILVVFILLLGVFGFVFYRRMYPIPPSGAFPASAAKYKLISEVKSSGTARGDMEAHWSTYSATENGKEKTIQYLISRTGPGLECNENGNQRLLKDKSGQEIGTFTICQFSERLNWNGIGFRKDSYFVDVRNDFHAKNSSSAAEMIEFVKAIPYFSNIDFPAVESENSDSDNTTSSNSLSTSSNPAKPDFTMSADSFYLEFGMTKSLKDLEKYANKNIAVTGRVTDKHELLKYLSFEVVRDGMGSKPRCYFDDDKIKQLKSLKEGQTVTLQGLAGSPPAPGIPWLYNCIVLEAK